MDGYSYDDFHNKCDDKGANVSLFKLHNDTSIAAFTLNDWSGSEIYK